MRRRWWMALAAFQALVSGVLGGMIVMAGIVAAIAFPAMKSLGVSAERYAAYTEEHWRLIAGHIAGPVFGVVESAILIGAGLLLGAALAGLWMTTKPRTRQDAVLVMLAVIGAALLVGSAALIYGPMQDTLRAYREAAEAGHLERAADLQASFREMHPRASWAMGGNLIILLGLLIGGIDRYGRAAQGQKTLGGETDEDQ